VTPDTRIHVAGHRGLAGSALVRALTARGYRNLIVRTHAEVDLEDARAVRALYAAEKPDVVVLAAARVGGILANETYPADFIRQNLALQTAVIDEAHRAGVQRLLFLGSSCIYPRECPQPIREEYVLTGPLENTNRAYAMAKLAGLEMCRAYNVQHATRYLCAMPTNLYGPGDNYDLETSHVLPALIRKFHDAKEAGRGFVTLWGSGTPRREFLYSDDMAAACVRILEATDAEIAGVVPAGEQPLINVGCGEDATVADTAALVREVLDSDARIEWDATKRDGTPRKLLDIGRITRLGWRPSIRLRDGIALAYADFLLHRERLAA
jgi:GDP-L-fucose synthase